MRIELIKLFNTKYNYDDDDDGFAEKKIKC